MNDKLNAAGIQEVASMADLTDRERSAVQLAVDMLDKAYAPYSHFHVGAAVVTASGKLYPGCNQENASYPLCICGERVALYNAGAHEHDVAIDILAITCRSKDKAIDKPISPCGACRQVISEYEQRHQKAITILLKGDGDIIYKIVGASHLLPYFFDNTYL